MQPADGSNGGVVSTTTQTFNGNKTITGTLDVTGKVSAAGNLNANNGVINGPGIDGGSNGLLKIHSQTDVRVLLDNDANGSQQFTVTANGNATPVFTVTEGGNVTATANVTSATTNVTGLSTAGIVTNTAAGLLGTVAAVPVANGGTGATTLTGSLKGNGIGAITAQTGTANYVTKWNDASGSIVNSLIQDNSTGIGIGVSPISQYLAYAYRTQPTATGDGQAIIYGFRTRDSQNDGTGYIAGSSNNAIVGYNYWGDLYTFGVFGHSDGDFNRTGGVIGETGGAWASLGYKNSASTFYGVYSNSATGGGTGFSSNQNSTGIGGGFIGGIIGSWSHGQVMGQVNSGELFASYNVGNEYTSGYSADLVNTGSKRVAAYSITSPELKVYDNGSAQLNGTSVFVPFNQSYSGMLSGTPDVTVSPVGSPAQLYIQSIERNGFTVAVAGGSTNVRFSWIAVGKRVDSESVTALPEEVTNNNFDQQMNDVMFNENNKEQSGKPIWWDGSKIRFDQAPQLIIKKSKVGQPKN